MTDKTSHGGNIYKMAKKLGIPESEVLDFSANINPIGLPVLLGFQQPLRSFGGAGKLMSDCGPGNHRHFPVNHVVKN